MYIVPSVKRSGERTYTYYNLVEGVRTPKGPRHRVILSLGKLEGVQKHKIKLLSRLIDRRLSGQIRLLPAEADEQSLQQEADRIAELVVQKNAIEGEQEQVISVKSEGIEVGEATLLGPVHVAHQMWRRLGFDEILATCGFSRRQRSLAMIEVVARLVHPTSELATSEWVSRTGLADVLGEKLEYVNKDALYRSSDRLWAQRQPIEQALAKREGKLFGLEGTMVLYDLTSTYFEGTAGANRKARRGYSREHRPDRNQVVVGMVLDEAGFPKASETWQGNTADSKTLAHMLEQLEARCGKQEGTTVIMDRGIASAANLQMLIDGGYHYIVTVAAATRSSWAETIRSADFQPVDAKHPQVEVCHRRHDGESYLLVRSEQRKAKDRAIRERFSQRLAEELSRIADRLACGKLSKEKAVERIGRARQRYQRASRFFPTSFSEEGTSLKLQWGIDEEKRTEAELLDGVYMLKTDRNDLDAERLWSLYMMLQRIERSFRYLKTSLGIRPIFHQREHRSDAHIFISILAYHLLHAVEQMLRGQGDHRSWPTINEELQTHRLVTVTLPAADGRTHHIRTATRPTEAQRAIYRMLNIPEKPLPTRQYVVEPPGSDENEDETFQT